VGKGKGKGKRKQTRTLTEAVAERHDFTGGQLGHATGEYAVNVTELTALSVDVVFACVTTIADLVADATIGEYRGTEKLLDSRIVLRPMASVTRRTWVKQVAATMALYNGCYLRVLGGYDSEGAPYSMVPISPSRITWPAADDPHMDGERIPLRDLRYIPRAVFPTASADLATVLRLARDAIGAAWAASAYSMDFWEAGGTPVIQITTDQAISPADADTIADRWVEKRTAGPGRPAVMGKGARASLLGADVSTEGAAAAGDRLGTSIARYFRVPPWIVNVPTAAGSMTYSNASAAGLDLVRYTLQPGYAGPIGDAWSDALPGSYLTGRRVVMDLQHLTLGTVLEQAQAYTIATAGRPWMLPSDVRERLHMPMDTALDEQGAPAPAMEAIA
jgi:phage portal protein BeeE